MKRLVLVLLLTLFSTPLFAVTHYVSKTGSSTPPYISWATAADSIQKAMNVASSGDTVFVDTGTYNENVVFMRGAAMVGKSMDSTVIDGRGLGQFTVTMNDSSSITGFRIIGRGRTDGVSILAQYDTSVIIENNLVENAWKIEIVWSTATIGNNIIKDQDNGIDVIFFADVLIANNFIHDNTIAVLAEFSTVRILNNLIRANGALGGIEANYTDLLVVKNNLIYAVQNNLADGMQIVIQTGDKAFLENNTVVGVGHVSGRGISLGANLFTGADSQVVVNNIVTGFKTGFNYYGTASDDPLVSYNNFWDNLTDDGSGGQLDSGNISLDPMFENDTLDYHLQFASPCIDAGAPWIKDPDSSRSDIGAYGGPLGQIYVYQDLAPDVPESLEAASESTGIILTWKPNTESDLGGYIVYKDSVSGFPADSFHVLGIVSKDSSSLLDPNWTQNQVYYYRVAAFDTASHLSAGSQEIQVIATDVWDGHGEPNSLPQTFNLSQNYPNPFNSDTKITYYLPNIGPQPARVEIKVYNILGQPVITLVNQYQRPGWYQITWDGRSDDGEGVTSGVYLYQLRIRDSAVTVSKKMTIIK